MPTVIEVSGSDNASSLKEDAISEQESIIKERNELQLKVSQNFFIVPSFPLNCSNS